MQHFNPNTDLQQTQTKVPPAGRQKPLPDLIDLELNKNPDAQRIQICLTDVGFNTDTQTLVNLHMRCKDYSERKQVTAVVMGTDIVISRKPNDVSLLQEALALHKSSYG